MKLYLLQRLDDGPYPLTAMIVRAHNRDDARKLADAVQEETSGQQANDWLDPTLTTCEEIGQALQIEPGLVIAR